MVDFPKPNEDGSCYFTAEQMKMLNKALAFLTSDPKGSMVYQFIKLPISDAATRQMHDMSRFLQSAPDSVKAEVAKITFTLGQRFQTLWYNSTLSNAFSTDFYSESDYVLNANAVMGFAQTELTDGNLLEAMVSLAALHSLYERHPQFNRGSFQVNLQGATVSQPAEVPEGVPEEIPVPPPAATIEPTRSTYVFRPAASASTTFSGGTIGITILPGMFVEEERTPMPAEALTAPRIIIHDEVAQPNEDN